jgi:hypothetical protein
VKRLLTLRAETLRVLSTHTVDATEAKGPLYTRVNSCRGGCQITKPTRLEQI